MATTESKGKVIWNGHKMACMRKIMEKHPDWNDATCVDHANSTYTLPRDSDLKHREFKRHDAVNARHKRLVSSNPDPLIPNNHNEKRHNEKGKPPTSLIMRQVLMDMTQEEMNTIGSKKLRLAVESRMIREGWLRPTSGRLPEATIKSARRALILSVGYPLTKEKIAAYDPKTTTQTTKRNEVLLPTTRPSSDTESERMNNLEERLKDIKQFVLKCGGMSKALDALHLYKRLLTEDLPYAGE